MTYKVQVDVYETIVEMKYTLNINIHKCNIIIIYEYIYKLFMSINVFIIIIA